MGEPSQLQIILCAKQLPLRQAESSRQAGESSSTLQQASYSETGASTPLRSNAAQLTIITEAQPAANTNAGADLPNSCQLATVPAPGPLAGHAQDSMIADQGRLWQQEEQYLPLLPDKVAALVKQHQLKVQLVQVTVADPFPMPLSPFPFLHSQ